MRAQQPIPVIVFFNSGTPSAQVKNLAAFRKGLKEAGLVEGQNLAIEFVWAENRFDGLETCRRSNRTPACGDCQQHFGGDPSQIVDHDNTDRVHHRSDPVRDGLERASTGRAGTLRAWFSLRAQLAASGLNCFASCPQGGHDCRCGPFPAPPRVTLSERRSKRQRKRLAEQIRIVEIRNMAEIETAVATAVAAGAGAARC